MGGGFFKRKQNNRGSAMILVLTILAFIAILGALAMSSALLNVRMRGINRSSDKNFYYLETALDEIYAQTGRLCSQILKEKYADVVGKLYQEGYGTNDEANRKLKTAVTEELLHRLGVSGMFSGLKGGPGGGIALPEAESDRMAEALKLFSNTLKEQNLGVTVGSVLLLEETVPGTEFGTDPVYSGLTVQGLCLTYVNPETDIESSLTVDLRVELPYVRFINNGDALLDYILISNGKIGVNEGGAERIDGIEVNGKAYGAQIVIENADIAVASPLFTAGSGLTIQQSGQLQILPREGSEETNRVWADQILVRGRSKLRSEQTQFYVRDDLTLQNDQNEIWLGGSYYGYGNEGSYAGVEAVPRSSSAIILNGKSNRLDLSGLDSLILAGRAYLRFSAGDASNVYPLGESLAVRATQTVYLIPEENLTVVDEATGEEVKAGTNPIAFGRRDETYEAIVRVRLPEETEGVSRLSSDYHVRVEGGSSGAVTLVGEPDQEGPAVPVIVKGKLYLYYNFASDRERSEYFGTYLEEHADKFSDLLQNGGMTGVQWESGEGFISLSGEGMTAASGALYEVVTGDAGVGEDGSAFRLVTTGVDGVSSSLKWVELEAMLSHSFENIQKNLAETVRVKDRWKDEAGAKGRLPIENYVKLGKLEKLSAPLSAKNEEEGTAAYLCRDSLTVNLMEDTASIRRAGGGTEKFSMRGGLIVSCGDVEITGSGNFNGLIIAGGEIQIRGGVTLTEDPDAYLPLLESGEKLKGKEERLSEYFYDYSDAAPTALGDYTDFVTLEHWVRAGREGGEEE